MSIWNMFNKSATATEAQLEECLVAQPPVAQPVVEEVVQEQTAQPAVVTPVAAPAELVEVATQQVVAAETLQQKANRKLADLATAVSNEKDIAFGYRAERAAKVQEVNELLEAKALIAKAAEELRAAKAKSEAELEQLALTYQISAVVDQNMEDFLNDIDAEFGI